ncbi:MAG: bifunctional folylpolyglutamate synthase/dihydrofolate synthase [Eubacterium sp.]|jgi:dihydrofolate synthase/folylpolyglutamate synthase|nr:bifunctional folylpolyglutamate synthase/dihydrofolate synthase [Eubacterium sp.]
MEFFEIYLSRFSKSGKKVTELSRFKRLCEALGNPHEYLRFIHVAGTNGKGSVSEYMAASLIADGQKVGKFTSPYVLKLNERIMIDYEEIDDDALSETMKKICRATDKLGETGYSQFELLTAAAFVYFKEKNLDIVIMEAGIGGLYDCTNIITPLVSVISKIDYDHCELLGDTLSQIAAHKAGIIKPGVPCVLYPNEPEAMEVLENGVASFVKPDVEKLRINEMSVFGNSFSYDGDAYSTTMGGRHQVMNAITAIEALQLLNVSQTSIKRGLNTALLMARMQVISQNPKVIIDGAHNISGVKAAAELVLRLPCKKVVIFGMLENKDFAGALEILSDIADEFVLVDDFDPKATSRELLLARLSELRFDKKRIRHKNLTDALEFAKKIANGGLVLSSGSLYLSGKLLRQHRTTHA